MYDRIYLTLDWKLHLYNFYIGIKIDHLDEKYTCCICGKEYMSYNSLAKHLRKFHNGLNKRKLDAIEKEMKMEEKKQKLG